MEQIQQLVLHVYNLPALNVFWLEGYINAGDERRLVTSCVINPEGSTEYYHGTTIKNPRDIENRPYAMKVAFKRAVQYMYFNSEYRPLYGLLKHEYATVSHVMRKALLWEIRKQSAKGEFYALPLSA
jgi:hypothetical protein